MSFSPIFEGSAATLFFLEFIMSIDWNWGIFLQQAPFGNTTYLGWLWSGGRLGARWRGPPLCLAGRRQAVGCGWLLGGDTVHSTLTRHNGTFTQLSTSSYHNSTRIHLLTHPSSGLEPGPDSDRTTPKIPAAQLHTSSHPAST